MKRLACFAMAGIMAAALIGCGNTASTNVTTSAAASAATTKAASSAAMSTAASKTAVTTTAGTAASSAAANATGKLKDTNGDGKITIGVSFKTVVEERWNKEAELLKKYAKEQGAEILIQSSENDSALQLTQMENLLTQGIDVLVYTAADESPLTTVLQKAHDQGIPIISYDYQPAISWCDACIGPYPISVGKNMTQALKDLNISGNVALIAGDTVENIGAQMQEKGMKENLEGLSIKYVFDNYAAGWDASIAMQDAESVISKYGNDITAFAVMNDSMAAGVISALQNAGLAGKVYVTGGDGELTAFQRIAEGTQTSTIIKPSDTLAKETIDLAVKMASGQALPKAEQTWSDNKVHAYPFYETPTILVTKDNLDKIVVDGGLYTHDQIYTKQ